MARHQDKQRVAELPAHRPVRLGDRLFLARMGAGGEPDRPAADGLLQCGERGGIGRQRRRRHFEIARRLDPRGAEPPETVAVGCGLGHDQIERPDQPPRRARKTPPAPERPLRHPPVEQHGRRRRAVRSRSTGSATIRFPPTGPGPAGNGSGSAAPTPGNRPGRTGDRRASAGAPPSIAPRWRCQR